MSKTIFTDGDPSTGVLGTIVTAAFLNALNNHRHTGVDADGAGALDYAVSTGNANVYAITLTPALTAYIAGMPISFKANHTNTGTATMNINGLGAVDLKKNVSDALEANDILSGKIYLIQHDGTNLQLLNPSNADRKLMSITATVNANALTLGVNPCKLDFRSATLNNGVPNTRFISDALTLIVPSGATLGTVNGQAARLVVLAIDNDGTVEPAVVNLAGGINLDETTLISTTAISNAANSNNVIYSTQARTNVPFRVVGIIDITEAIAGTWATGPSLVQGCGGQAMTALASLGYGQTWQNVTSSRVSGTTYYNTTGKPIALSAGAHQSTLQVYLNGVIIQYNTFASADDAVFIIVPSGCSYSIVSGGGVFSNWHELR